jgi:putative dimethyl sulfoxide reductase chaperone
VTGLTSESTRATRPVQVAPRAAAYGLLAAAFRYPEEATFDEVASGKWLRALRGAWSALPHMGAPPEADGATAPSLEAAQVEYTRLFDVGPHGPPCPLTEGHYTRDRLHVMEELIRFFDYFGLRFQVTAGLMPDHLSVEMEFMQALAGENGNADVASLLRAQCDFLDRHVCRWLPELYQSVTTHAELPLYPAIVGITSRFAEADRAYLVGELRRLGQEERP